MDKKKRILTIATLTSMLALALYTSYEREYDLDYHVYMTEDTLPYGSYSNGDIYIGDEEYINSVRPLVNEDDILIIMGEQNGDPNATIVSSHRIKDKDEISEIIRVLAMYEYEHPSDWERTVESMRVEWEVHNFLYNLGVKRDRTQDVDLDNSEEKIYNNSLLRRLIK